MKLFFSLALFVLFVACATKGKTEAEKVKTQDSLVNLEGEYECYVGSIGDVYEYHKLKLKRNGNDFSGTLFSGYYLSANEEGYYSVPSALVTSAITGTLASQTEVMLYLGDITDSLRTEKSARMPDQRKLFSSDAQDNPVLQIYKKEDQFHWVINNDTLLFTPIKQTGN